MVGGRNREVRILGRRVSRRAASTALLVSIGVVICLLAAVFILRGLEVSRLRGDLDEIRLAETQVLAERQDLEDRLAQKDDPEAIEDEARRRLGLVLPGEEKVVFEGEDGGEE